MMIHSAGMFMRGMPPPPFAFGPPGFRPPTAAGGEGDTNGTTFSDEEVSRRNIDSTQRSNLFTGPIVTGPESIYGGTMQRGRAEE